jgi:hypothetical protein
MGAGCRGRCWFLAHYPSLATPGNSITQHANVALVSFVADNAMPAYRMGLQQPHKNGQLE